MKRFLTTQTKIRLLSQLEAAVNEDSLERNNSKAATNSSSAGIFQPANKRQRTHDASTDVISGAATLHQQLPARPEVSRQLQQPALQLAQTTSSPTASTTDAKTHYVKIEPAESTSPSHSPR